MKKTISKIVSSATPSDADMAVWHGLTAAQQHEVIAADVKEGLEAPEVEITKRDLLDAAFRKTA